MKLFEVLRPAPHIEPITDQETVKKMYRYWRIRIFLGMYTGYIFYYFSRKSLTFAMPDIMSQLGYTQSQMGLLVSLISIMQGCSKFMSGVIADRSNPRYFMAIGLLMTGVSTCFFSLFSSLLIFCISCAMNGWFQGWGWPPCARQLTHWYSQKERGRWWGFWNTSHSLGISGIAILGAVLANHYGWRAAMFVPGILCMLMAFVILLSLRDTPQSLGLPPIEKFKNDHPPQSFSSENELSAKQILFQYVLNNSYIWILATVYFFIYVIRQGVTDWGVLYLIEAKQYTKILASSCIVSFEVGGFCGSLAAGWISDSIFKGMRGPVNALFSMLMFIPLTCFCFNSQSSPNPLLDSILFGLIGFLVYGPQLVIGMHAAELAHKKASGTSTGFVGWFAYLGAAAAGYPLSIVAQTFGWDRFFLLLVGCSVIASLLLIPLWSARSHPKYAQ